MNFLWELSLSFLFELDFLNEAVFSSWLGILSSNRHSQFHSRSMQFTFNGLFDPTAKSYTKTSLHQYLVQAPDRFLLTITWLFNRPSHVGQSGDLESFWISDFDKSFIRYLNCPVISKWVINFNEDSLKRFFLSPSSPQRKKLPEL
jgi:hypothetical protein